MKEGVVMKSNFTDKIRKEFKTFASWMNTAERYFRNI